MKLYKFESIAQIIDKIPFDRCIIDMVIGLQGKSSDIRPEMVARKELKNRASTLFPAPCRKAVYENTKEERIKANVAVLGKKFTSQTDAIIPKIREVDEFLQSNAEYKNVILESHPELCFGRLNGEVLATSKHDIDGIVERVKVLKRYLEKIGLEWILYETKRLKCQADDIVDAACLAVAANLDGQGKTDTIPAKPMQDETGLYMKMTVPKRQSGGKYAKEIGGWRSIDRGQF